MALEYVVFFFIGYKVILHFKSYASFHSSCPVECCYMSHV